MTAEPAGRVITAALVVVPGPGDTVTFVRQERGPYAGWWLLPGGKVEPHPTDMPILDDAAAAAYPGELIAGRLARSGSPDQPSDRRDLRPADDVPGR